MKLKSKTASGFKTATVVFDEWGYPEDNWLAASSAEELLTQLQPMLNELGYTIHVGNGRSTSEDDDYLYYKITGNLIK